MNTNTNTDSNYEAARRRLAAYEDDFRRYEEENKHQPAEWWDESKQKIRQSLAEMRVKLDSIKENAPDAWGEIKDGVGKAYAELATSYHRAIREVKAD